MLKRIRKHYHTTFGGEVPKAMDVAIGRVVAVVSDTAGSTRRERETQGYDSQGTEYGGHQFDETALRATEVNYGPENQYVDTVHSGNAVMSINDFDDATLCENFPNTGCVFRWVSYEFCGLLQFYLVIFQLHTHR